MSTAFSFPAASESTGTPWPPGTYEVELISIEKDDRQSPNPKYQNTGPRAKWTFHVHKVVRLTPVADRDQYQANRQAAKESLTKQTPLLAWTSIAMGPKAKMRGYVESLLGRKLALDEIANPNDVLGKRAEAVVAIYLKESGGEGIGLDHLDPLVNLGDEGDELPF